MSKRQIYDENDEQAWRDYTGGVDPSELPASWQAFLAGRASQQQRITDLEAGREVEQTMLRNAAERITDLEQQLAERDAVIARVQRMPNRHEVVPIEEPIRLHAFLKGYETAVYEVRAILDAAPESVLDRAESETGEQL